MNKNQLAARIQAFTPKGVSKEELDRIWRLYQEEEEQMRLWQNTKLSTEDESANLTDSGSEGEGDSGKGGGGGEGGDEEK